MRRVLAILLVALMLFVWARPVEAGKGGVKGKPDDAPTVTKGKSPSVPDDDGKGKDRGLPGPDKPSQGGDGNNGSGNDQDCEDDNNGVGVPAHCKPIPIPIPVPPLPTPQPKQTGPTITPGPSATLHVPATLSESPRGCKLVCLGHICELFPEDRFPSPGNEKWILAEARGRLEYPMTPGQSVWVFFWTPVLGHGPEAYAKLVTCLNQETIVVTEPSWSRAAARGGTQSPR
jgi:hypothetical protein